MPVLHGLMLAPLSLLHRHAHDVGTGLCRRAAPLSGASRAGRVDLCFWGMAASEDLWQTGRKISMNSCSGFDGNRGSRRRVVPPPAIEPLESPDVASAQCDLAMLHGRVNEYRVRLTSAIRQRP